ncbi:MAG: glycosyltransferase [Acidobacteriota bacterium]|nr:glycosyltransferase [Acidobacteriota bacterium]
MKHVALLIPGLDRIGGAERQVILLAKGLCHRNWRVSVVALSGNGGCSAGGLCSAGAAFLSLEMRRGLADPRGWIRFHRWLRREKPDVVHAHLPHAAWLARWSRLGASVPVQIDTLHSSSTGALGRRLGYRLSGWLPDRVTAVGPAVAESHLSAGMVRPEKLAILPNGVDLETFRPDAGLRAAARRELGLPESGLSEPGLREPGLPDQFLWFAAGRLDAVKDYPTLLRAMAATPQPAHLVIAGGGPLQDELLRLSKNLGLGRRVRFLGFAPDVQRWMQAADAYVLSSLWEGLPMSLMEAGACALPAAATDVPGVRDVIVPGLTGCLAPAGDAAALANAMTAIMHLPREERRAMGNRARQRVSAHFGLNAVLDRWEQLYADLLAERAASTTEARIPRPIRPRRPLKG